MLGGERTKLAFRAAQKGVTGEGSMMAVINKWRRTLEAELIAKYGEISAYQDARIIAACHWDLCRKRRNELARAAATAAERIVHDEQAAANCEKRDRCLEQAGLRGPVNGKANGDPDADAWANLHANGTVDLIVDEQAADATDEAPAAANSTTGT